MTYDETLEYLYNTTPVFQKIGSKAYKAGMENSFAIDSHFNHPHKSYHIIHVAGTNGKGSTSHILASTLQQAGYKIGLYTSPHLTNFNERIRVNGIPIEEQFVIDFVKDNQLFFEELQPSFFEVTTGMALLYFAWKKVDIAVIEVGLGGRLDCTNVVTPDLSIITNISFDHTALLGNTLPLIAKEKAGIIKKNIPVVIGEASGEVKEVFLEKAQNENAPITFAEDEKPITQSTLLPSGKWCFETKEYPHLIGELGGLAQEKNASTILCVIQELKKQPYYNIPDQAVYDGFANVIETTGLLGRWQIISHHPKIVFDTGHNVGGIEYIVQQLQLEKFNHLHFVLGMVNDKDISSVLQLLPENATYYFTKASIPRALDETTLAEEAHKYGLSGTSYPTVPEALNAARNAAKKDDFIFVGGSTFIVADALKMKS